MSDALNWDAVDIEDENISEEDMKNAESSGRLPAMKFLGTCESSIPREAKLKEYTTYEANLKWHVDEVLECPPGTPATDVDKEAYEGRFCYDGVLLPHPKEKQGMKNRRVLIAKRLGLINNTSDKIPSSLWANAIVGAQAIITTEEQSYVDKSGNPKTSIKVKFDGYEAVTGATSTDTYDDI
jgi:hypothetical protein